MSGELFIALQCEELPSHNVELAVHGLKKGIEKLFGSFLDHS